MNLDFEVFEGEARAYFKIDDRFQGFEGITHGGIISSILAECMGVLVSSLNGKFLGREICAEFLKVMPVNENYEVVARLLEIDGNRVVCEGYIRNRNGEIAARGKGVFVLI
ncbi:MAG: PaaI family thioesterase [candidate division WOR-3 bacterium]